jgi:Na+/proline symporter
VIGGASYILFAFVPMFVVACAVVVMGDSAMAIAKSDYQKLLPTFVLTRMPLVMQILFFGALLSAIKSTASATLLAPSVTFTENIWRQFRPAGTDRENLMTMRITVLLFSAAVLGYAIRMQGTSIYELVSGAYQVPLVGAFVPLVAGLYWNRASTQGAVLAVVLGIGVWLLFMAMPWGEAFPGQLAGVLASALGMVIGSLAPQWVANQRTPHRPLATASA